MQFAWTDLSTLSKDPNQAVAPPSQRPRKRGTWSPQLLLLLGQHLPLSQFTMPFCHIPWLFFFYYFFYLPLNCCWISPCKHRCPASGGSAPSAALQRGAQAGCQGQVGGEGRARAGTRHVPPVLSARRKASITRIWAETTLCPHPTLGLCGPGEPLLLLRSPQRGPARLRSPTAARTPPGCPHRGLSGCPPTPPPPGRASPARPSGGAGCTAPCPAGSPPGTPSTAASTPPSDPSPRPAPPAPPPAPRPAPTT